MKILVVGSGGREHALAWKLKQSPSDPRVFCAPGNAGTADLAESVDIAATDVEKMADFAEREGIDLTIVGPEAPLCAGMVDEFERRGLSAFGPSAAAARLEGDKAWCKDVMSRHSIPTASHRTFTDAEAALAYVAEAVDYPMVVKAAGLAAGKGVIICADAEEAEAAVRRMMIERAFGAAGDRVVVEDFLEGEEASVLAITDGATIAVLESSQDHKRAFDGDEGPNTGGMGAYSPAPVVTAALQEEIERDILVPIVHAMNHERCPFRGVLYAGLMITRKGPRVLEFNVRFGDPECQALLVRLRADLVDLLLKAAGGRLEHATLDWDPRPSVSVVMAQSGYPGQVGTGSAIRGIREVEGDDVVVFHAGTKDVDGLPVAIGGRVLNVTALGDDLAAARARAYAAIERIDFPGSIYRTDIGARAIGR